jgi:hypothetical protein
MTQLCLACGLAARMGACRMVLPEHRSMRPGLNAPGRPERPRVRGYLNVTCAKRQVRDAPSIGTAGESPAGDEEAIFKHYGLS